MNQAWITLLGILLLPSFEQDPDADGDGLSDFQEVHKYCTNPARADTDGDGVDDGDWLERREYTYSIRTVLQILAPYNKQALLQDDYQDARILLETEDYLEIEVIHYPLNSCADGIEELTDWRKKYARYQEYLQPGVTTNWDAKMRKDLLAELKKEGIRLEELTDREAVEAISEWALARTPSLERTAIFTVHFPEGKPAVHPRLREKFENQKGKPSWSDAEHFDHELFGKGMYYNQTRGTCTTSANFLSTVLRAAGIPTRMIVTVPAVDPSDPDNVEMIGSRLQNHQVRATILKGMQGLENSFAAHTFNEVLVGGRWHRLNYQRLGQNILDPHYMGLLTKVHTFLDLADAGLGEGWGLRHPHRQASPVFRHNNPYTALTISDLFGEHCDLDNPSASQGAGDYNELTISKAYWFHSDRDRPRSIGEDWERAKDRNSGHILFHVEECDPNQGFSQYNSFFAAADKNFVLRAKGKEDVQASALQCWWVDAPKGVSEFYLQIPATQYRRMSKGVRYSLFALNEGSNRSWKVEEPLRLVRR